MARISVECPSAQGYSGARASVECTAEQGQVSKELSDSPSDTKPYDIRDEKLRTDECVVHDPENIEDEIRLFCTPSDKDTCQVEEEDTKNAFLEDISQKLLV